MRLFHGSRTPWNSFWPLLKKSKQPFSPTTSFASFIDDLSDLLAKLGDIIDAERLVMCGDLNCSGVDSTPVHGDLSSLLDTHGLQQFVNTSTRRTSSVASLLDLVIGSASSKRIQQVASRCLRPRAPDVDTRHIQPTPSPGSVVPFLQL